MSFRKSDFMRGFASTSRGFSESSARCVWDLFTKGKSLVGTYASYCNAGPLNSWYLYNIQNWVCFLLYNSHVKTYISVRWCILLIKATLVNSFIILNTFLLFVIGHCHGNTCRALLYSRSDHRSNRQSVFTDVFLFVNASGFVCPSAIA